MVMPEEVFFSVIIPTYNRADHIRKVLDTLVAQTFKNFEVLVCDDGSTDGTGEVVKLYADKLNLRYLWNENWGGPARPRNIGIKECKGQWVCFLDSDDWWYPNKLAECFKYTLEYDVIYHSLDVIDNNKFGGKKVGRYLGDEVLKDLILNGNGIANSSVSVKKSIMDTIGPISESKELIAVEDYDYWMKIAAHTNKFKFIQQSLGAYLWETETNISQISKKRIYKEIYIFNKYINYLSPPDKIEARKVFNYKIGRYYGILGAYPKAIKYLVTSLSSKSSRLKLKALTFYAYFLYKLNLNRFKN
jgi:glycosyltransferase involved in cell wall biosynthesis